MVGSAANVLAGEAVSGSGIPVGTTVSSVNGTTVTLSQAATVSNGAFVSFTGPLPSFVVNNSIVSLFQNMTVAGLAFNSTGSAGNLVTLNGMVLTLPANGSGISSSPTSVSSNDVATINSGASAGYLSLNGTAQTFTVLPTLVGGVNAAPLQSGLTVNAIIVDNLPLAPNGLGLSGTSSPAGSVILTGGGVLQLSGANTFSGGLIVAGSSSLIIGASSTPTANGSTVTAGPVGTGTLTLDSGASLLSSAAGNTIANNVLFNGTGTYTFNGPNSLTLTGAITLPNSLSIDVVNPGMTATLAGTIVDGAGGSITITKFGLGTLVLNQSFSGTVNSSSGALSFLTDGVEYVGTADPEIVTFTTAVNLTGPTTINIGRLGTTLIPEFTTASNKTVSLPNLTLNGNDLTLNNLNGYGLLIPGAEALGVPSGNSGFGAAGGATGQSESFSVIAASTSNTIPGLIISGLLSNATGVTSIAVNKLGVGTMELTNASNTFTGPINIEQGVLSATANGALGNASNQVNILGPRGSYPGRLSRPRNWAG